MNSLPYEIQQHISSFLLPRYQCRFALTSHHHYNHLYSPLLRWHARKASIPVPVYNIAKGDPDIAIMKIPSANPRILVIVYCNRLLFIKDATRMKIASINDDTNRTVMMDITGDTFYGEFLITREYDILAGYYEYIHKDVLLRYINMRLPIYSMPNSARYVILGLLTIDEIDNMYGAGIY